MCSWYLTNHFNNCQKQFWKTTFATQITSVFNWGHVWHRQSGRATESNWCKHGFYWKWRNHSDLSAQKSSKYILPKRQTRFRHHVMLADCFRVSIWTNKITWLLLTFSFMPVRPLGLFSSLGLKSSRSFKPSLLQHSDWLDFPLYIIIGPSLLSSLPSSSLSVCLCCCSSSSGLSHAFPSCPLHMIQYFWSKKD